MRSVLASLMNGGSPFSMSAMGVCRAADDEETLGVIDLDMDLNDVEKPPELPPGKYVGEVQEVTTPISGKGNKYFAIKFVIPADQIPPDVAEHYDDGAVLFWNRNVVPNGKDRRALYNLKTLIQALGLPLGEQIDPSEWMGCKATLNVVHGKYNGEVRAEIKALTPAEASAKPAARGKKK